MLAALLALLPTCVVHYTIGDTASDAEATCPEGQQDCTQPTTTQPTTTCPDGQQDCTRPDTDDNTDTDTINDSEHQGEHGDSQTTAEPTTTQPTGDPACAACDPKLETCSDSSCTCRPGLTRCGAACIDLRTDPAHCGECGKDCGGGVCQTSACREACAGDLTNCADACVPIKQDSLHCGNCATLCALDEVCLAGTCRPYQPAGDCDTCPCPACGDGQPCCDSLFLAAPVCVPETCGG